MYGERDTGRSQKAVHTPQKEVGKGIQGDVQVHASTPVTKPINIVLAPTKGGTREEGRRRRSNRDTRRGRDGDAVNVPGDGRLEAMGVMAENGRQESR